MSTEVEQAEREYEAAVKRRLELQEAADAACKARDQASYDAHKALVKLVNLRAKRDAELPNQCIVCSDGWSRQPAHILGKTKARNLRVSKNGSGLVSVFVWTHGNWRCGSEYLENVPAGFQ